MQFTEDEKQTLINALRTARAAYQLDADRLREQFLQQVRECDALIGKLSGDPTSEEV